MRVLWVGIPAVFLLVASAGQAWADDVPTIESLAKRSGCLECHATGNGTDKKLIGPTFPQVAARYQGNAPARNALVEILKKGGKGNWTDVSRGAPMPPYSPRLSDAEIKRLVDWVLNF